MIFKMKQIQREYFLECLYYLLACLGGIALGFVIGTLI